MKEFEQEPDFEHEAPATFQGITQDFIDWLGNGEHTEQEIKERSEALFLKEYDIALKNNARDRDFIPEYIKILQFIRDNKPSIIEYFRDAFDAERVAAVLDNLPEDSVTEEQLNAWDNEINELDKEINTLNSPRAEKLN